MNGTRRFQPILVTEVGASGFIWVASDLLLMYTNERLASPAQSTIGLKWRPVPELRTTTSAMHKL